MGSLRKATANYPPNPVMRVDILIAPHFRQLYVLAELPIGSGFAEMDISVISAPHFPHRSLFFSTTLPPCESAQPLRPTLLILDLATFTT